MHAGILALALAIDLVFGEPPARLHPVVWMGAAIGWLRDRAPQDDARARFGWGLMMALVLPAGCAALGALAMALPGVGVALGVLLTTSALAVRSLGEGGARVGDPLQAGDLEGARQGLSWLCSRDPDGLSAEELAGAAVESLAENASDAAIAPVFWFVLLGVPGALAYRCVNTMDAMIGYRGRYEWLGKAAARLDDVLNLVPARLTAVLLVLAAPERRWAGARVAWRDAGGTASPNAGWPMSAMAGLLGVQLTKRGHYALGDPGEPLRAAHIAQAWAVAWRAMVGGALAAVGGLALAQWP
ncbi:MAG: cobalamin biosynthesis protein CobD [Alphaproteobacteria bacterium]|nr:cobalamin biosynthesis protein CobD [Alphaproteobacteria bacterium]